MLIKYIIKVFLYLILAVMTFRWLLKIPMMLGNILLYFLSIIFILTGVLVDRFTRNKVARYFSPCVKLGWHLVQYQTLSHFGEKV